MSETCQEIEPLLSGYMDEELDETDRVRVERHLADCGGCRRELEELRGVVEATAGLFLPSVEDEVWDEFLGTVYNRLERRTGWTLFVLGALLAAGFIVYEAAVTPWASPAVKVLFATPFAGLGLLFISVLRQRLHVAKTDRYSRDVRR